MIFLFLLLTNYGAESDGKQAKRKTLKYLILLNQDGDIIENKYHNFTKYFEKNETNRNIINNTLNNYIQKHKNYASDAYKEITISEKTTSYKEDFKEILELTKQSKSNNIDEINKILKENTDFRSKEHFLCTKILLMILEYSERYNHIMIKYNVNTKDEINILDKWNAYICDETINRIYYVISPNYTVNYVDLVILINEKTNESIFKDIEKYKIFFKIFMCSYTETNLAIYDIDNKNVETKDDCNEFSIKKMTITTGITENLLVQAFDFLLNDHGEQLYEDFDIEIKFEIGVQKIINENLCRYYNAHIITLQTPNIDITNQIIDKHKELLKDLEKISKKLKERFASKTPNRKVGIIFCFDKHIVIKQQDANANYSDDKNEILGKCFKLAYLYEKIFTIMVYNIFKSGDTYTNFIVEDLSSTISEENERMKKIFTQNYYTTADTDANETKMLIQNMLTIPHNNDSMMYYNHIFSSKSSEIQDDISKLLEKIKDNISPKVQDITSKQSNPKTNLTKARKRSQKSGNDGTYITVGNKFNKGDLDTVVNFIEGTEEKQEAIITGQNANTTSSVKADRLKTSKVTPKQSALGKNKSGTNDEMDKPTADQILEHAKGDNSKDLYNQADKSNSEPEKEIQGIKESDKISYKIDKEVSTTPEDTLQQSDAKNCNIDEAAVFETDTGIARTVKTEETMIEDEITIAFFDGDQTDEVSRKSGDQKIESHTQRDARTTKRQQGRVTSELLQADVDISKPEMVANKDIKVRKRKNTQQRITQTKQEPDSSSNATTDSIELAQSENSEVCEVIENDINHILREKENKAQNISEEYATKITIDKNQMFKLEIAKTEKELTKQTQVENSEDIEVIENDENHVLQEKEIAAQIISEEYATKITIDKNQMFKIEKIKNEKELTEQTKQSKTLSKETGETCMYIDKYETLYIYKQYKYICNDEGIILYSNDTNNKILQKHFAMPQNNNQAIPQLICNTVPANYHTTQDNETCIMHNKTFSVPRLEKYCINGEFYYQIVEYVELSNIICIGNQLYKLALDESLHDPNNPHKKQYRYYPMYLDTTESYIIS
ncbi:hypothetical protein BDAP_001534 [Binucleata daphniae]